MLLRPVAEPTVSAGFSRAICKAGKTTALELDLCHTIVIRDYTEPPGPFTPSFIILPASIMDFSVGSSGHIP